MRFSASLVVLLLLHLWGAIGWGHEPRYRAIFVDVDRLLVDPMPNGFSPPSANDPGYYFDRGHGRWLKLVPEAEGFLTALMQLPRTRVRLFSDSRVGRIQGVVSHFIGVFSPQALVPLTQMRRSVFSKSDARFRDGLLSQWPNFNPRSGDDGRIKPLRLALQHLRNREKLYHVDSFFLIDDRRSVVLPSEERHLLWVPTELTLTEMGTPPDLASQHGNERLAFALGTLLEALDTAKATSLSEAEVLWNLQWNGPNAAEASNALTYRLPPDSAHYQRLVARGRQRMQEALHLQSSCAGQVRAAAQQESPTAE